MRSSLPVFVALGAFYISGLPAFAQNAAPPAANTEVKKGEVLRFTFEDSKIFPGSFRDYWVYVPAQYSPDKPACVYVNQDGVQWKAPQVFDELIAKGEMPVTIGVFVMHGRVRAADGKTALDRFNRSLEYDGLGDNYARFILDELLPTVEKQKTSDGRPIRLSHDGNDRAIGGSSSGAVCAWTAAWERPDGFRRVFSAIGTYVGLRGADRYPTLIRKTEPKPLRVFLQDGSNDLNIYGGDWWMANQMMERALTFAGYDVRHVWGEGGHNGQQGTEVFPDAMRWLWSGWPAPVTTVKPSGNRMLNDILVPEKGWQVNSTSAEGLRAVAASPDGGVVWLSPTKAVASSGPAYAQAWGADGKHYYATAKGELASDTGIGTKATPVARGLGTVESLVVAHNGNRYAAQVPEKGQTTGALWIIRANGSKAALNTNGLRAASALTLSPDQTLLYAAEAGSHWVWSYQIQADGTLRAGQRYFWLHAPDDMDDAGAASLAVDRDGRLYVATAMGVQVCDQAGRVNVILPLPENRKATAVAFGGKEFDTLYVATKDTLYRRSLKIKGAPAFTAPLRPAPPGL